METFSLIIGILIIGLIIVAVITIFKYPKDIIRGFFNLFKTRTYQHKVMDILAALASGKIDRRTYQIQNL